MKKFVSFSIGLTAFLVLAIFSFINFELNSVLAQSTQIDNTWQNTFFDFAEAQKLVESLKAQLAELQAKQKALQDGTLITGEKATLNQSKIQNLIDARKGKPFFCYQSKVFDTVDCSNPRNIANYQKLMSTFYGYETLITGKCDDAFRKAIIKFQEQYRTQILTPWGITTATGNVGPKTRNEINRQLNDAYGYCDIDFYVPEEGKIYKSGERMRITWTSIYANENTTYKVWLVDSDSIIFVLDGMKGKYLTPNRTDVFYYDWIIPTGIDGGIYYMAIQDENGKNGFSLVFSVNASSSELGNCANLSDSNGDPEKGQLSSLGMCILMKSWATVQNVGINIPRSSDVQISGQAVATENAKEGITIRAPLQGSILTSNGTSSIQLMVSYNPPTDQPDINDVEVNKNTYWTGMCLNDNITYNLAKRNDGYGSTFWAVPNNGLPTRCTLTAKYGKYIDSVEFSVITPPILAIENPKQPTGPTCESSCGNDKCDIFPAGTVMAYCSETTQICPQDCPAPAIEPTPPQSGCKASCGDGVCVGEVTCLSTDCPCAENTISCPQDCPVTTSTSPSISDPVSVQTLKIFEPQAGRSYPMRTSLALRATLDGKTSFGTVNWFGKCINTLDTNEYKITNPWITPVDVIAGRVATCTIRAEYGTLKTSVDIMVDSRYTPGTAIISTIPQSTKYTRARVTITSPRNDPEMFSPIRRGSSVSLVVDYIPTPGQPDIAEDVINNPANLRWMVSCYSSAGTAQGTTPTVTGSYGRYETIASPWVAPTIPSKCKMIVYTINNNVCMECGGDVSEFYVI